MIDENLSWEEHVNYISKKVAKGLGMLRRIRDLVPINTLVDIFSSIILPHFDYCSSVWDNQCRKGLRDKLQKLQNRAARIITRSNYEIRSSQISNNLNWPTLEDRRMKQKSCLMFKVYHKLGPSWRSQQFNRANLIHSHGTRGHDYNFVIPKPNTIFLKNSLEYNRAVVWNSILIEIRNSTSLKIFKNKL
jgi:hypothetical protein